MNDEQTGVGVNGEPDDFAARYDRMVSGGGLGWAVKTVVGIVILLAIIAVGSIVLGL